MTDKKTLYSFFITIFIILMIYIFVSADSNSRAMGFGGEMPRYSSLAEEIIHSNDITLYLYRNKNEIYRKLKLISSPEEMIILTLGEKIFAEAAL